MARILIDGAGTVGIRVARAALSSGYDVGVTKNQLDVKKDYNELDIRTREFLELYRYFDGCFPVYVLNPHEESYAARLETFRCNGVEIAGTADDIDYGHLTHALNCAKDKKGFEEQNLQRYRDHGYRGPVLFQAKAPPHLWGEGAENGAGVFNSVPNSTARRSPGRFVGRYAANGSCNDTFLGTATGIVLDVLTPHDIEAITAMLSRRYADPETKPRDKPVHGPVHEGFVGSDHDYITHFDAAFPELGGALQVLRSKNPWEAYHYGTIIFRTRRGLRESTTEAIRQAFRDYERCVFVENGKISAGALLEKTEKLLGVSNYGNFGTLLYTMQELRPDEFAVSGFNDQRASVVASNIDWVGINEEKDVQEAVEATNRLKWHCYTFAEIKHALEKELNG